MTKTMDQIVSETEDRLKEVEITHREYLEIEKFLAIVRGSEEPKVFHRELQRTGRAGRPVGSGRRHHEALRLLAEHGPMTATEIAGHMGIQRTYIYRVLALMQERGQVARAGSRWVLAR